MKGLEARVAALERLLSDRSASAAEATETAKAEATSGGLVTYRGAVLLRAGEYRWEVTRPVTGLLAVELEQLAEVFAALGSPARLLIVRTLLEGPLSAQQLQERLGLGSPGQLYHHLKALLAAGVIEQRERSLYNVPARNVVPLLAALAIAVDIQAAS